MKYIKFNKVILTTIFIAFAFLFAGCNNEISNNAFNYNYYSNNYSNYSNNTSLINSNNYSNYSNNTSLINSNSYTNSNSAIRLSSSQKVEENLSSFSTTIYIKESERQNNINITCSSLNGTIVKSNEEFSFCDTVGKATPDKGYQKADIFDANGNVVSGYGRWQLSNQQYFI